MKLSIKKVAFVALLFFSANAVCVAATDVSVSDSIVFNDSTMLADLASEEEIGTYKALKNKFIEGNPLFMSLVALSLILGLAFCIERIIFLSLANIDTKAFLKRLRGLAEEGKIDEAEQLCIKTSGPVAAISHHALAHRNDDSVDLERKITSYAEVQVGKLEKGCSWITLFIAIAPSLGFLGTVIGMVMAFDNIQIQSDISPSIVASGMKVALITTIFGIVVAVVLQIFYNYILSRIEHLTSQMEQAAIELLEIFQK